MHTKTHGHAKKQEEHTYVPEKILESTAMNPTVGHPVAYKKYDSAYAKKGNDIEIPAIPRVILLDIEYRQAQHGNKQDKQEHTAVQ